MLLVPDLHVHARVVDDIIDGLRDFVDAYP
jgi:hypothetical protein